MSEPMNLAMPGNPRYQPTSLVPFFGYDNLTRYWGELEWALLEAIAETDVMPDAIKRQVVSSVLETMLPITMTEVDRRERITGHDVAAYVELVSERLPPEVKGVAPWIHFTATSFDIRDSAMVLDFARAYKAVMKPTLARLLESMAEKAEHYAATIQIGRTHGQHAIPITVGFWLATILGRLLNCAERLDAIAGELRGKFSGAVGAYNAQVLFGLTHPTAAAASKLEELVLAKVGLQPALISSQVLSPEPLADFLHACVLLSGALAQFASDCRQLMRTEIGEVAEEFSATQQGSSTMGHKRNPVTYEGIEGVHTLVRSEYVNVLHNLISEHQRDLRGSSISRQYPAVMVLTQYQLERTVGVLSRMVIDEAALERNFSMESHVVMAEAMQLALRRYGYADEVHRLFSQRVVPLASPVKPIWEVMLELALKDEKLLDTLPKIPVEIRNVIRNPRQYIGLAPDQALRVAFETRRYLEKQDES